MITFLDYLMQFFQRIFTFQIVNGITLHTILYYNLILISFWVVFTRRG